MTEMRIYGSSSLSSGLLEVLQSYIKIDNLGLFGFQLITCFSSGYSQTNLQLLKPMKRSLTKTDLVSGLVVPNQCIFLNYDVQTQVRTQLYTLSIFEHSLLR